MSPTAFYRDQADKANADADAATLDNVRDRCRRAATAWTVMADRVARTEALRTARESKAAGALD